MRLYSTRNPDRDVDFPQAVFQSLPADNGLYMPRVIPRLSDKIVSALPELSFQEISLQVAKTLLADSLEESVLRNIIEQTINFPAPLRELDGQSRVLELFHGPSMAFKDFGARFMSRVMAHYLQQQEKDLHILVATSGDTGGAVALGFYEVPRIHVTILYPSGKVSPVQEKQLTTLGKNISAIAVEGSFDDCQQLVKQAFLDRELNQSLHLSSANSINIARLIPQTFYYFHAYGQLRKAGDQRPVVFSVPSGNFGNLTAGLIAWKMGLPVHRFVASTNINDEVPRYLSSGVFTPRPSAHTLSNAMDVGNPSNFARMLDLFGADATQMTEILTGYAVTDQQTRKAIHEVATRHHYLMCPHTAVAYLGLQRDLAGESSGDLAGIFLSTAHPCKFPEVYGEEEKRLLVYPPQAAALDDQPKNTIGMEASFDRLRALLLARHAR